MGDTASGFGSFGGGFAKGLANILYRNQQQQREDDKIAQARKDELNMKVLGTVFEHGDPEDVEPYLQHAFPDVFGTVGKPAKTKAGQPGPMDHVRNVLSHFKPHLGTGPSGTPPIIGNDLPSQGGITGQLPRTGAGDTATQGALPAALATQSTTVTPPADLPMPAATVMIPGAPGIPMTTTPTAATPTGKPTTPATAKRPTLFGVRMQTRDEIEEGKTGVPAKIRLAQKMYDNGTAKTLDEALDRVGLSDTRGAGSITNRSVPGMLNGKRAFGVFNTGDGKFHDSVTGEILDGFVPLSTTASRSLGADRESIAKELFNKVAADLTPEEMAQVNALLPERAGTMAEKRGLGTGRAKIQTELNSPIGTTAAAQWNVPPTTTLGQLAQMNGLTAEQQEKVATLSQVDTLLSEIDEQLPKVFPTVEPGLWGRLQSQDALGMKTLAADEDLAKLDAAINGSLAQIAQLSGQPGSRLSDKDIDLAKAELANLTPSFFRGDTILTARARVSVLRRLLIKAQTNVPTRTSPGATGATPTPPPAAPPPPGTPPPGMIWDGKAWVFQ